MCRYRIYLHHEKGSPLVFAEELECNLVTALERADDLAFSHVPPANPHVVDVDAKTKVEWSDLYYQDEPKEVLF